MPSFGLSLTFLIISVVSVSASQVLLKARFQSNALPSLEWGVWHFLSEVLRDPYFWGAGILIAVSAIGWYAALPRLPLSLMLAVAALFYPLVGLGSHFFLGESMTAEKFAALALITCGIVWLSLQQP